MTLHELHFLVAQCDILSKYGILTLSNYGILTLSNYGILTLSNYGYTVYLSSFGQVITVKCLREF